jgi:hypothetical protein
MIGTPVEDSGERLRKRAFCGDEDVGRYGPENLRDCRR